jgi:hypothetical protein
MRWRTGVGKVWSPDAYRRTRWRRVGAVAQPWRFQPADHRDSHVVARCIAARKPPRGVFGSSGADHRILAMLFAVRSRVHVTRSWRPRALLARGFRVSRVWAEATALIRQCRGLNRGPAWRSRAAAPALGDGLAGRRGIARIEAKGLPCGQAANGFFGLPSVPAVGPVRSRAVGGKSDRVHRPVSPAINVYKANKPRDDPAHDNSGRPP